MKKIFLSLLILATFAVNDIVACSCYTPPVQVAFGKADIVFSGEVVSAEDIKPESDLYGIQYKKFKFKVIKRYKNVQEDFVVVTANARETSCGPSFDMNSIYVIFGSKGDMGRSDSGGYVTGLCSPNMNLTREDFRPSMRVKIKENLEFLEGMRK